MTPAQVVATCREIKYKPGWRVWAVADDLGVQVRVRARFRTTQAPHGPVDLEDVEYLPMHWRTERTLLRVIRGMILKLEEHEINERLTCRGRKPFDPHA